MDRRIRYVPKDVWQACKLFTKTAVLLEPLIKKILLFGSYSRSQQHTNSDIDIAIFVDAPAYFYTRRILLPRFDHELFGIQYEESDAVGKLRFGIQSCLFPLKDNFSVHIITPSNAGSFVDEAEKGITLYSRPILHSFAFLQLL